MNHNKIFCTQQGHQQSEVNHICTYRWCSKSRWCCSLCLSEKIHDHQISKNHIMNYEQLSEKVKYDIEKLKKDYLNSEQGILIKNLLSDLVRDTFELEQNIFQFRQILERYLNNIISDDDNFNLQSLLNQVEGQYLQLNDKDINKLFNIKEYKFQINFQLQLQDKLDKIKQKLNRVLENLKDQQENINGKNQEIQKIEQFKEYEEYQECEESKLLYIKSSTITKKEQFLVYNINDIIHIYDIKMKKNYKIINQNYIQSYFKFTTDSKYLFAGDGKGFVYGYFLLNGFKRFYKQQIHQQHILQIIIQKYYLITASWDDKIIKTDFITKMQIFKLHSKYVFSIDYDISKAILVSTSHDQSIKVWDCANQSILIDYTNNTDYQEIQFMNNKQDIICNTDKKL